MMMPFRYAGIFMLLPFLLFLVAVGIGIFFLVKLIQNSNSNNNTFNSDSYYRRNSALNILDERFARGEISEDEYKNMKKTLNEQKID